MDQKYYRASWCQVWLVYGRINFELQKWIFKDYTDYLWEEMLNYPNFKKKTKNVDKMLHKHWIWIVS